MKWFSESTEANIYILRCFVNVTGTLVEGTHLLLQKDFRLWEIVSGVYDLKI